jgi:hypothetical protein
MPRDKYLGLIRASSLFCCLLFELYSKKVIANTIYSIGTRLGNLALGLYSQGKRAIAHGVCK